MGIISKSSGAWWGPPDIMWKLMPFGQLHLRSLLWVLTDPTSPVQPQELPQTCGGKGL